MSIAEAWAWADCDHVDAGDNATSRARIVKVLLYIAGSPPRAQSASRDYTPREGTDVFAWLGARGLGLEARGLSAVVESEARARPRAPGPEPRAGCLLGGALTGCGRGSDRWFPVGCRRAVDDARIDRRRLVRDR